MKRATFTEFRNNAKDFIDMVEKGETIEIYRHGKPVARVVPLGASEVPAWKRPVGTKIERVSISKIILSERERTG